MTVGGVTAHYGESKVGGQSLGTPDVLTLGGTAGVPLTDRIMLTLGYSTTINDNGPREIRADGFLVSLTYSSAELWRGFDRLLDRL